MRPPPPTFTDYHAAYWAAGLTATESTGTVADLTRSLANARVDLNPHQIDAALFAIRSPFARGVILADEVGLGKTIDWRVGSLARLRQLQMRCRPGSGW